MGTTRLNLGGPKKCPSLTAYAFLFLFPLIHTVVAAEYIQDSDVEEGYYHYEAGYLSDREGGSEWQQVLTGRSQPPKCIDIPQDLRLCRNMRYNRMRLPNLLDHETIGEVIEQAKSWVSLLGIRCHPDTQVFLCSLFSPVCLEKKIYPCRTLCEAVKAGCESYMLKYGFPWPEMVRCDKFPLGGNLCIGLQNDDKPDDTICEPCNKPTTVEGIVDSYCSSEFAIRIKIKEEVITHGDLRLTTFEKKRMYKKGNLKKRETRGAMELFIDAGENCECARIEGSSKKVNYLVMGNKTGDRLMLNYVAVFDRKDPDLKKALRAIRKQTNICAGGLVAIRVADQPAQKRTRKRDRKQREPGADGTKGERKGKKNKQEGEDKETRNRGNRNRDRDRERSSTKNEPRRLNLED